MLGQTSELQLSAHVPPPSPHPAMALVRGKSEAKSSNLPPVLSLPCNKKMKTIKFIGRCRCFSALQSPQPTNHWENYQGEYSVQKPITHYTGLLCVK